MKASQKLKGKDVDSVVNENADQSSQANSKTVREELNGSETKNNRKTDYEFSTRNGMYMQSDSRVHESNKKSAAPLKKKLTVEIHSASQDYDSARDNIYENVSGNKNDYKSNDSRQDLIFNKENTPIQLKDQE